IAKRPAFCAYSEGLSEQLNRMEDTLIQQICSSAIDRGPHPNRSGRRYRLSSDSPGSVLFMRPSKPAINIPAKARYGFADGSGGRNSTHLAFGLAEYIGIRTAAAVSR